MVSFNDYGVARFCENDAVDDDLDHDEGCKGYDVKFMNERAGEGLIGAIVTVRQPGRLGIVRAAKRSGKMRWVTKTGKQEKMGDILWRRHVVEYG